MASISHIGAAFKQALIYGGTSLIGKAVGFVMLPIYAHYLGGEGYGVLGMIDVVITFLALLIGYGVSSAMTRFYYEAEDDKQKRTVVSTTIMLMFLMVSIVTLPAFLFYVDLAHLAFGRDDWGSYIVLALLTFVANMTSQTAENYIVIRQKALLFSGLALGRLVVELTLNIYFVVVLEKGVEGWLYASLATGAMYSIAMHGIVFHRVGFIFDQEIARRVLAFSLPMLPGYMAMFVRGNADRVMLRALLGLGQLGVFEMLFKFVTLVSIFAVEPFLKSWMVKVFEICDLEDGPATMARAFTYHMAAILFFVLLISLEIPLVLQLLTPAEFWLSGFIVFFAVLSRGVLAAYYHIFFGLLYAKKTFKISIIQISSALVSLGVNWILIGTYGLMGAVLAALFSVIFQCVIAHLMARPYFRIPFEWGRVSRMFLLAVGMFWAAKEFSIKDYGLDSWLSPIAGPWVREIGMLLRLDDIKNGKILAQLIDGVPLMADGILLFLYSGIFIVGLIVLKVIPAQLVLRMVRGQGLELSIAGKAKSV